MPGVRTRLQATSEHAPANDSARDLGTSAADGRIVRPDLVDRMHNYVDLSAPGYAEAFVESRGGAPRCVVSSPAEAGDVPVGFRQQWDS